MLIKIVRKGYSLIQVLFYSLADLGKPYLSKLRYLGFDVYYTKGAPLINRIRWGNFPRRYEPQLSLKIVEQLRSVKKPLFVDIGANIGLVSLSAAALVRQATIYAFEPGRHQYLVLQTTLLANRLLHRIFLYNQAVSNKTGEQAFYTYGDKDGSGDGFVDTGRSDKPLHKIMVKTTRLDDWWLSMKKPMISVVKIDTEGAELFVLQGAVQTIMACRPALFIEIADCNLKKYPYTRHDILAWFEKHEYQLQTLSGQVCTQENLAECCVAHDMFAAFPLSPQRKRSAR